MTSIIGLSGNAGQANYASAKAGIIGLTKSAAKELASRNVTCNAIAPGFIKTDMTDTLSEKTIEKHLGFYSYEKTWHDKRRCKYGSIFS